MTVTTDHRADQPAEHRVVPEPDPFDLDITMFEAGDNLAEIIRMTDDGCGSTCESACNSCSD